MDNCIATMIRLDSIIVASNLDEIQVKDINRRLDAVGVDASGIVTILPCVIDGIGGGLIVYFRYKTHWKNLHDSDGN